MKNSIKIFAVMFAFASVAIPHVCGAMDMGNSQMCSDLRKKFNDINEEIAAQQQLLTQIKEPAQIAENNEEIEEALVTLAEDEAALQSGEVPESLRQNYILNIVSLKKLIAELTQANAQLTIQMQNKLQQINGKIQSLRAEQSMLQQQIEFACR